MKKTIKKILIELSLVVLIACFLSLNGYASSLEKELYGCVKLNDNRVTVSVFLDKARDLISSGADLEWVNPQTELSFIQHFIETYGPYDDDKTYNNRIDLIEIYFKNGGRANVTKSNLLYWPLHEDHAEIVEVLLANDVSATEWGGDDGTNGYSPIEFAEAKGSVRSIEVLKKYGAKGSPENVVAQNRFVDVARYGSLYELKEALSSGAEVNTLSSNGISALVNLLSRNRGRHETYEKFVYLINQGADVNLSAKEEFFGEQSPLHASLIPANTYIEKGYTDIGLDIINTIIERSSSTEIVNEYDYTPLQYAVSMGLTGSAEALLKAGARTNIRNYDNKTLTNLARNEDMIDLLSRYGVGKTANIDTFEFRGHKFGESPTRSMSSKSRWNIPNSREYKRRPKSIKYLTDTLEKKQIGNVDLYEITYRYLDEKLYEIYIQFDHNVSCYKLIPVYRALIDKYYLNIQIDDDFCFEKNPLRTLQENGVVYFFSGDWGRSSVRILDNENERKASKLNYDAIFGRSKEHKKEINNDL